MNKTLASFTSITITLFTISPTRAGDTFVRNDTVYKTNRTETSLEIDTVTNSNRTEHYNSYSEKIFFEDNLIKQTNQSQSSAQNDDFQQEFVNNNSVLKLSNVYLNDDNYTDVYNNTNSFNGLTIHRSGSSLTGTFVEDTTTRIKGTVYSVTNESFRSHETTAGVR
ncbi:hypothetical protein C7B62_17570 [Pleurocapsa sp. CCALA 161]|uniref:hypothetical protein n=1 Tax=Pleurocapsa sp. CCALA 161 TaxID=2107688 RepID=UPI000D074D62|nr:hypothetical protein [Pleurocapsa sp. CCALA 161]PSB08172.1 hypothetical protein C7B62_17570 [Pleurocapsa sp. CCALA 161]